ncbi:hypothetical protein T4D_3354 [Trichinella pseudospiralis]|uniref:Uncharacterized protein n=1 Tax=Trichinella pseudospiralis TaxID=6337 RepID=A0A0V1FLS4_TRIPS|nr:hypothetical protein T4D_3354 [Trichinella pseudospiralis]
MLHEKAIMSVMQLTVDRQQTTARLYFEEEKILICVCAVEIETVSFLDLANMVHCELRNEQQSRRIMEFE